MARLGVAGLSATQPRLSATPEPATPTASISSSPSSFSARLLCSDFDLISSFRGILSPDAVCTTITIQGTSFVASITIQESLLGTSSTCHYHVLWDVNTFAADSG
ncbi:unnamed protein product [Miscanthus lutarioriparius]|uniref:Uncharacterized protein n=1 Tax=Miscanthus lutarioriparius TaxID=422564 RepID=A0A811PF20_9POAL|nr:unnamed protein product [Miscanthus lutarioriparius]